MNIKTAVLNVAGGIGEPFFDSIESVLSSLIFSIPGVKGVEFGKGFEFASLYGSEANDEFIYNEGIKTTSNNNGGINGGVSNGNDIVVNIFIKPTPSIYKEQQTFNFDSGKVEPLIINGRHDSAIIERAMIVCENAIAIALCDLYLLNKIYK